jgi:PBSX family phage portal protein
MGVKVGKVSRGIVTEDGNYLPMSTLQKYVEKVAPRESKQIKDSFADLYDPKGLIEPMYPAEVLAGILDLNTYHYRAVKTKANDTVGLGWSLQPKDEEKGHNEAQKKRALQFLEQPHPNQPLGEILKRAAHDYESIGYCAVEIIRTPTGEPLYIDHIPAQTLRRHRDGVRFCQQRAGKQVWFKMAGSDIDLTIDGRLEKPGSDDEAAGELFYLYNFTSRSDYYGAPDVVPAMGALLADYERAEYNIDFFKNNAVPAYAVTVTGAEVDDEIEEEIQGFFKNDLKKNRHSTLVLSATKSDMSDPDPVKIQFEPLAVETKEASFRLFRQDNREEILSAHGVPPYRAGIAIEGKMGGSTAKESTEIYKQSVINPRQAMWENAINRYILQDGFGVTDWVFKFDEIDTRDEKQEVDILERYFRIGGCTPNDILKAQGKDPVDHPAMDWHYINGRPIEGQTMRPTQPVRLPFANDSDEQDQNIEDEESDLMESVKALHRDLVRVAKGEGHE